MGIRMKLMMKGSKEMGFIVKFFKRKGKKCIVMPLMWHKTTKPQTLTHLTNVKC